MKTPFPQTLLSILLAQLLALCGAHAVTVTVTPDTVTTEFSGTITLDIENGLLAGETVIVEKFFDFNGNGVADPGEPLTMRFLLTDGEASVIDGVTNINIPHDLNPVSGEIEARVQSGELSAIAGTYLFRVSSPSERFAPATAAFTVTPVAHAQSVSGVVRDDGGVGLPYALVALLRFEGEDDELEAGTIADEFGAFSIAVPPGTYMAIPIRDGYLMGEPEEFEVEAGIPFVQDIEMVTATRILSGRVVDAGDPTVGLPGVAMFFDSEEAITLGFTDASGNFSVSVSPGEWFIEISEEHLARLGYVGSEGMVDTGAGDVTGIELGVSRVTALFYGFLEDGDSNPLSGIEIFAGYDDFFTRGITDEDGYYVVGAIAGDWWIGPSQMDLAEQGYAAQGTMRSLSDGEAVRVDFTAIGFTANLSGQVVDEGGNPVAGIGLSASHWFGEGWSSGETDENGNFSIGVFGGTWNLELNSWDAQERNLVGPRMTFGVSDGVDITDIIYVAQTATATIGGSVQEADGTPVAFVSVFAHATIDDASYHIFVETDGGGNYSLGAFDGTWNVGVSGDELYSRGFAAPENQVVEISGGNETANFTVYPLEPLEITTESLADGTVDEFYWVTLEATGGVQPYHWSLAPGSDPLPPGLWLGGSSIFGTPSAAGTFIFTVQVTDWFGENATKPLSLTIGEAASFPIRFTSIYLVANGEVEMILAGQEGATYRLEATGTLSNPDWIPLEMKVAGPGGWVSFRDADAPNFDSRFYRAREVGP